MSKVLRIQEGGYKIITEPGSEIRLDTGLGSGQVRITGDLIVEGDRTDLEVSILNVEDRMVVINNFPDGSDASLAYGIIPITDQFEGSAQYAGIEIKRGGGAAKIRMVFDEASDVLYSPPHRSITDPKEGMFVFRDSAKNLIGINTNYIKTNQYNLTFDVGRGGTTNPNTVVSIKDDISQGGVPYHLRLLNRNNNNDIPNIRYIKDYVRAEAGSAIIEKFSRFAFDETGNSIDTKTGARATDFIADDQYTGIFFTVGEGSITSRVPKEVANIDLNGLFIGDKFQPNASHLKLYVQGDQISITTDKSALTIAPENGLIKFRNTLQVEHLPEIQPNPTPVSNNNIVYSRGDQGAGGTGIYFANVTTAGEICSAAKALVYGLIF